MTIEEVKTYLLQVRNLNRKIQLKKQQLNELNLQKFSIGSQDCSSPSVKSSPSGDAIPRMIAKITDLQEEINADVDRLIDLKAEIMHKIDLIQDANQQSVLYDRYLQMKTIQQIADESFCCTRTVKRLHKAALQSLGGILDSINRLSP